MHWTFLSVNSKLHLMFFVEYLSDILKNFSLFKTSEYITFSTDSQSIVKSKQLFSYYLSMYDW